MFGKKQVVGLDLGSSSIKIAELRKSGKSYKLVKFGMSPIDEGLISGGEITDPVALSHSILDLYKKLGIKNKSVCTGLFGGAITVKKIFMPKIDKKLIGEQIRWEAEQYIPFDLDEANLAYHILENKKQDSETINILLVAAKQDNVIGYLEAIELAGLECSVVDVNSFALANCFEINYGIADTTVAIINMGAGVSNLVVIENGNVVFCRDIPIGGSIYNMEIIREFNISPEEAQQFKVDFSKGKESPPELENIINDANNIFSDEVRESFKFYNQSDSGAAVKEIFLCGGSVKTPGLVDVIGRATSINCQLFDPFQNISYSNKFSSSYISEISPFLPCVLGLGIRKVGDS